MYEVRQLALAGTQKLVDAQLLLCYDPPKRCKALIDEYRLLLGLLALF